MAKKLRWSVSAERLAQLSQMSQDSPPGSMPVEPPQQILENPQVIWVDLDQIRPNPFQPRREMSADRLDELSSSIQAHGLLQPLVGTPNEDGSYTLIAGHRRWAASRQAGLKHVPLMVRTVNEPELKLLALIENIQREDLHVVDKALALADLSKNLPTTKDAAGVVGLKRTTLANWLRIAELSEAVLALCRQNPEATLNGMLQLSRLASNQQVPAAKRWLLRIKDQGSKAQSEPLKTQASSVAAQRFKVYLPEREFSCTVEVRSNAHRAVLSDEDVRHCLQLAADQLRERLASESEQTVLT
ncbi:MAG: ParB/RepB/Spo0J family partition protein [Acidobacteria bacterium]|nr:ParB/RepB/Spo0J family partition protein [Acidobacteriota bacterium]